VGSDKEADREIQRRNIRELGRDQRFKQDQKLARLDKVYGKGPKAEREREERYRNYLIEQQIYVDGLKSQSHDPAFMSSNYAVPGSARTFDVRRKTSKGGGGGGTGMRHAAKFQTETHTKPARVYTSDHKSKVAVMYKGGRAGKSWGQRPGRVIATGGQKIKSVVKTKYVQRGGEQEHLHRLIGYLQDREYGLGEKERKFFTKDRTGLDGDRVEKEMEDKRGRRISFHKMIISPGDNSINMTDYVRRIMEQWEKVLGRPIDYYGVVHENTDHTHAHLIIPGLEPGSLREIKFNAEHLAGLRFISDEYIARDRELDTELDRMLDINLGFMENRFADLGKLLELGQGWFRDWRDQVELGLRTDEDNRKDMEDLGMGIGKVYDLGRSFDGVKVMTEMEIREMKRARGDPISQWGHADGPDMRDPTEGNWDNRTFYDLDDPDRPDPNNPKNDPLYEHLEAERRGHEEFLERERQLEQNGAGNNWQTDAFLEHTPESRGAVEKSDHKSERDIGGADQDHESNQSNESSYWDRLDENELKSEEGRDYPSDQTANNETASIFEKHQDGVAEAMHDGFDGGQEHDDTERLLDERMPEEEFNETSHDDRDDDDEQFKTRG
jgi:hypothetical protein